MSSNIILLEEKLRLREEELRYIFKSSNTRYWEYNIRTHALYRSKGVVDTVGKAEFIENVPEVFIEQGLIHKDSVAEYLKMYNEVQNGHDATCVFRAIHKDGSFRWMKINYHVIFDNEGKPYRAIGEGSDLSDLDNEAVSLDKLKRYFLYLAQDTVFYSNIILDTDYCRYVDAKNKEERVSSYSGMINNFADSVVVSESKEEFRNVYSITALRHLYKDSKHSFSREYEIEVDRKRVWIEISLFFYYDKENSYSCALLFMKNITEKKNHEIELESKVTRDYLTNLYTRQAFEEIITKYHSTNDDSAFIIIDIDEFKSINDRFGHTYGDYAIQALASKFKAIVPPNCYVSRMGGDEFAIYVPNVTEKNKVETLVKEIHEQTYEQYIVKGETFTTYCSIGIYYARPTDDFSTMYKRADEALYSAKHLGKNQFFTYGADVVEYRHKSIRDPEWILNNINDYVLVVSKADCSLLYMNKKVINDFAGVDTDVKKLKCFDIFKQSVSRCEICMLNKTISNKSIAIDDFVPGHYVTVNSKDVDWDGIPARLVIIRDSNENQKLVDNLKEQIIKKEVIDNQIDEVTGAFKIEKFKKMAVEYTFSQNNDIKYFLVFSDISNFKYINDHYGVKTGDKILKDFVSFVKELKFGESITQLVSRISGDNFVILSGIKANKINDDIKKLEEYIAGSNKTFSILEKNKFYDFDFSVVSGVYVIDPNNFDIELAIDNANLARKMLKKTNTAGALLYKEEFFLAKKRDIDIVNSARNAIMSGEFECYLQPKIKLSTGKIIGYEALARWNSSKFGFLSPAAFIPLFEKYGLIEELDNYILEKVLQFQTNCVLNNIDLVPVSINQSRVHFMNSNYVKEVEEIVSRYNIERKYIELELTESIFTTNNKMIIDTINKFRSLGYLISMDDFGTGYSSLNILKDVQFDVIKLDKDFLNEADKSSKAQKIIESIVTMCKSLKVYAICEGVETKPQEDFLKEIKCDFAQGYLYKKPVPAKEVLEELSKK